uniref:Uncharacterized protein n=1 Tax=viral metagenome TaxID=1070528 RepID=A0A6C0LF97_9ZZZZ
MNRLFGRKKPHKEQAVANTGQSEPVAADEEAPSAQSPKKGRFGKWFTRNKKPAAQPEGQSEPVANEASDDEVSADGQPNKPSYYERFTRAAANLASHATQPFKEAKKKGESLRDEGETSQLPQLLEKPVIKNKELSQIVEEFKSIISAKKKGYAINTEQQKKYDNIEDTLETFYSVNVDPKDQTETLGQEIKEAHDYIETLKSQANEQILSKTDEPNTIINTKKTVIEFKRIADICKMLIMILVVICIFLTLITLIISFINVINLCIKLLSSIVALFYNSVITNNQSISYSAKEIIKCTKNNFKYDIFNILNEQLTSLSVFNTTIYIIYILLFYVILFILAMIFVNIYQYTHVLNGGLKDIDPKFQLLTIVGMVFGCSLIHLLIYKFLFRNLSFNKFKDINNYEVNIDNVIALNLSPINKEYDNDFFDLMADSTKRAEIDNMFSKMVLDIEQPSTNLSKYLLMYDLYMYFDEYVYMNDVVKEELRKYFKLSEEKSDKTLISFLDSNERKLIKLYHEALPFYSQIPADKLGAFQKVNEKVAQIIGNVNKSIIKYTGTFFPFLICCIYIIGIFIFNAFCTYMIMMFIESTREDKMFPGFIYNLSSRYISVITYFYNIFKI